MADLRTIMMDEKFHELPLASQTEVMRKVGATDDQIGGWVQHVSEKTGAPILSQAQPSNTPALVRRFQDFVNDWYSTSRDREKAKEAGIGLNPTTMEEATGAAAPAMAWSMGAASAVPALVNLAKGAVKTATGAAIGGVTARWAGPKVGINPDASMAIGATVGAFSPGLAKKALVEGPIGLIRSVVGAARSPAEAESVLASAQQQIELQAARAADRKTAMALAERRVAVAEERNRLLKMRIEGRAPTNPPTGPAQQPVAPSVAPVQQPPAASPADQDQLVLALQQQMSTKEGRAIVNDYLKQQPFDVQSRLRLLLAHRQAHPATVAVRPPTTAAHATGPQISPQALSLSAELAKLLGQ